MTSDNSSSKSIGYLRLLKHNPAFRNLWYGQVISELGDWLNSMAIYALVLELSGSGMALATSMMAKLLPIVVVSPLAGIVIDRFNRKTIMIASDLLRFGVVLSFLFVRRAEDLWLLYVLVTLETVLAGFFEPARSAIIPSITSKKDLVTANALSGSTWSAMLAFGAALGGVVVALFGIQTAFVIDACTFLFSGWFIFRIPVDVSLTRDASKEGGRGGWFEWVQGLRYMAAEPVILVLSLLKSGLAFAGGVMTLIPLYAHQMVQAPMAHSMATGILFSARGLGAVLGPPLVKRLWGDSSGVLQNAIAVSFFLSGVSYMFFAQSQTILWASISLGIATLFGSNIWVFSSALIHMQANKAYLGRIFSTEMALLTLVMGLSNLTVGLSTDRWMWTPHQAAMGMAVLCLVPGVLWTLFLLVLRHRLKRGQCVDSACPVDPSGFNPAPVNPLQNEADLPSNR